MKAALTVNDFRCESVEQFLEAPHFDGRRDAFKLIAKILLTFDRPLTIVETGCMRPPREPGRECEDGCSTLLWDWIASETKGLAWSVDSDPANVKYTKSRVSSNTVVVCDDSIHWLADCKKIGAVDLIYLDSCDYKPETQIDSIIHTAGELAAVWPRLNSKGLIVADDFLGPFHGKGALVRLFCEMFTGCMPLFLSNVCCWRKP